MKRILLLLLALFLSGCTVTPMHIQIGGADINAIPGSWQGTYTCRQGITNLNLLLQANPNTYQVTGVFQFSANSANPSVPNGSYQVAGTLQGSTLYLRAGNWIRQPAGYVTLDVDGSIDTTTGRYTGKICGYPFELRKASGMAGSITPVASADAANRLAASVATAFPATGRYDGSDRVFTRTLEIRPDGRFSIEVLEKGKPGNLHSGTGEGKLVPGASGWQFMQGTCRMGIAPDDAALQVQVSQCASEWGPVEFDGRYRPASQASVAKNARLAAYLNCHALNLSENGAPRLLAQLANVPQAQVWDRDIAVSGYAFQGLPIQSANISETDGGFLAIFAEGSQAVLQAAIRKANTKGNTSVAALRTVGGPGGYRFAGKPVGQSYVECRPKNAGE